MAKSKEILPFGFGLFKSIFDFALFYRLSIPIQACNVTELNFWGFLDG